MSHLPSPLFDVPPPGHVRRDLPRPDWENPTPPGPQKGVPMSRRTPWWHRLMLPGAIKGLWTAVRHIWQKKFTIQWPEEVRQVSDNYRFVHRLNKDEQGRPKCVACFLCQTACPANCIRIEGAKSPWPDREKYCVRFDINELRCIYCGMCEEACPEDAIELTRIYSFVGTTRDEMIYDKEQLLKIFDITRDEKHPQRW